MGHDIDHRSSSRLGRNVAEIVENIGSESVLAVGIGFERRCLEAEVPGRAHGLRKGVTTISAENGATGLKLMAISGLKAL